MSDTPRSEPSHDEMMSAMFAQMVLQQANMAMMLLGKMPHPQSGETMRDLESAKMFIDQLEMIEAKTKGNLSKQEAGLLKQSLMSLRMAYVEAVDSGPALKEAHPAPAPTEVPAAEPPSREQPVDAQGAPPASEAEHRPKFSKKY
jgi:hypothetical protein